MLAENNFSKLSQNMWVSIPCVTASSCFSLFECGEVSDSTPCLIIANVFEFSMRNVLPELKRKTTQTVTWAKQFKKCIYIYDVIFPHGKGYENPSKPVKTVAMLSISYV